MWVAVIQIDKASIQTSRGQIFITRYTEETYNINCCIFKFREYLSQMIYSSISYRNKRPLVIFKKDQSIKLRYKKKIINSDVYCTYICFNIKAFAQELWQTLRHQPILIEDNTLIHLKVTHLAQEQNGMLVIEQLANSPNLNLIKNIQRLLKGRI